MCDISLLSENRRSSPITLFGDYKDELSQGHYVEMHHVRESALRGLSGASTPQQKADAYQDLALLDLAYASHKLDNQDPIAAAHLLRGDDHAAFEAINNAKALAPNDKDSGCLEDMAKKFEKYLPTCTLE